MGDGGNEDLLVTEQGENNETGLESPGFGLERHGFSLGHCGQHCYDLLQQTRHLVLHLEAVTLIMYLTGDVGEENEMNLNTSQV